MKLLTQILTIIYLFVINLFLMIPRTLVLALSIVESVSRVLKNTTAFLQEQIREEAINKNFGNHGKTSGKEQKKGV